MSEGAGVINIFQYLCAICISWQPSRAVRLRYIPSFVIHKPRILVILYMQSASRIAFLTRSTYNQSASRVQPLSQSEHKRSNGFRDSERENVLRNFSRHIRSRAQVICE